MVNLEHCIKHMYGYLMRNIHTVHSKVRQFVNVLRKKNVTIVYNATKAVRESVIFDRESPIDCEFLACAIHDIVYIANNQNKK